MNKKDYSLFAMLLGLALCPTVALLSAGCGGDRDSQHSTTSLAATGRAQVTVRWPERSRLIPFAANSIQVRIVRGGSLLGVKLLVRPTDGGTATATFDTLSTGTATVEASAFPVADGTGVAQATGSVPVTIVGSQTTPVHLTLSSTIDSVSVVPANPPELSVGQKVALTATPRNAGNETVLIKGDTLVWSSQNPAIATVDPDGTVTAVAPGQTTVQAKETESGKVGSVTLTIVASGPTPVAWWKAEGNGLDATGANHGATVNNVQYAPGISGQAFNFNGVDTSVNIPDNDDLKITGSMTIDTWIMPRSFPTGANHHEISAIVFRGDWRGMNDAYFIGLYPGYLVFAVDRNDYERVSILAPITLNEWHHVTGTIDGTTNRMTLYLDGVVVGESTVYFPRIRDLDPNYGPGVGIGNHANYPNDGGYQYAFDGLIDEVKIYNEVVPPQ